MKAALLGVLPFLVFAVAIFSMGGPNGGDGHFVERIGFLIGVLLWTTICGGFYVLLAGIVSGWIAHRIAFETAVPVSRLAIAIAWVANLSLWGWVVVVAITDS